MMENESLTILINSILKLYFEIDVLEWYDDTTFYGGIIYDGQLICNKYSVNFGSNIDACYSFMYMGEDFHIMIERN